jgi:hypothetical protein
MFFIGALSVLNGCMAYGPYGTYSGGYSTQSYSSGYNYSPVQPTYGYSPIPMYGYSPYPAFVVPLFGFSRRDYGWHRGGGYGGGGYHDYHGGHRGGHGRR